MTEPMRVLVTGSRTWEHVEAIEFALDHFAKAAAHEGFPGVVVVHGCAKGADTIAGRWSRNRKRRGWPVSVETHPAEWHVYGKRAGFLRNKRMVELGADICLAFIRDESKGATQCADLAESAGIRTERFVMSGVV